MTQPTNISAENEAWPSVAYSQLTKLGKAAGECKPVPKEVPLLQKAGIVKVGKVAWGSILVSFNSLSPSVICNPFFFYYFLVLCRSVSCYCCTSIDVF